MSTPFHPSSNTTPDAPTGTSNVAIVTGASSGIGLEVTKRLAAKGYRVVANSRNITSAMTLEATTADLGPGTDTWGNGDRRRSYMRFVRGRIGHIVPDDRRAPPCDIVRSSVVPASAA